MSDDDDGNAQGSCPSGARECSGSDFTSGFKGCETCTVAPTTCDALIGMVKPGGCYSECGYGWTKAAKDSTLADAGCNAEQKKAAEEAIEQAEAAHEGDATTAGLSVAAACALAVASLYHM